MQTQTTSTAPAVKAGNVDDADYEAHLGHMSRGFGFRVGDGQLFSTDAEGLWEAYLGAFPPDDRQFHTCNTCRHFIQRFGHLVTIAEDGTTTPAVWCTGDVQGQELAAISAMERLVRRAKVTGLFLSSDRVWGQPTTGVWRHMSLQAPKQCLHASKVLTAGQAMAEKLEDFRNVRRALAEFTAPLVDQALGLLKSDALYRSEKVLGQAQWLADVHAALEGAPKHRRDATLWRFVGAAPAGFCHPRSSMIGTLLEDIAAGLSFDTAANRFADKMHPLRYQRPQAAPKAGAIEAAEKLVAQLGIERSLQRRFARLDELVTVWKPQAPATEEPTGGVFGHLKARGAATPVPMTAPAQDITWTKFAATVLGDARSIEVQVPAHGSFAGLLTADDPDAPPILQWDMPERRNPVSWYLYVRGSSAIHWGLRGGTWAKVNAITLKPSMWNGGFEHQGKEALLIIDGAKDSRTGQGNCLFPETLKSELHAVRATIEAYAKVATLHGREEASANGLLAVGATVRVTNNRGVAAAYRIDRWD